MQGLDLGRRGFGLVLLGGLAACSKPSVQTTQAYMGGRLPRPERVLVEAFAVTPDEVKLDQGVAARMQRANSDVPLSVQQMQVAREAQSTLADTMVRKLMDYGLPSARVWGEQLPPAGRYLLVQGQIVAVDQGNRTRRTLVGFGAGKSEIAADMQLYFAEGERRPVFLTAYDGSDGSGRGPGMAETMGVGGAAGNLLASTAIGSALHLGTESRRANSQSEATRLGEILAKQVAMFAVSQGWLPPNAVS
ncbi:MAG: hypothetical protein BGO51_24075 [Rhodospirillales bacterium 69-11]|nr:DUF4410 domain-containing protein [Rhodospirillales bacterium]MBN8928347.1 DUF4410 domain-containing protein [Rhodospirillales bacterium]OJW22321.1 MAG: hypothetical protein BGO51_24075 [Rhodospirillales bacterium 69-11]